MKTKQKETRTLRRVSRKVMSSLLALGLVLSLFSGVAFFSPDKEAEAKVLTIADIPANSKVKFVGMTGNLNTEWTYCGSGVFECDYGGTIYTGYSSLNNSYNTIVSHDSQLSSYLKQYIKKNPFGAAALPKASYMNWYAGTNANGSMRGPNSEFEDVDGTKYYCNNNEFYSGEGTGVEWATFSAFKNRVVESSFARSGSSYVTLLPSTSGSWCGKGNGYSIVYPHPEAVSCSVYAYGPAYDATRRETQVCAYLVKQNSSKSYKIVNGTDTYYPAIVFSSTSVPVYFKKVGSVYQMLNPEESVETVSTNNYIAHYSMDKIPATQFTANATAADNPVKLAVKNPDTEITKGGVRHHTVCGFDLF